MPTETTASKRREGSQRQPPRQTSGARNAATLMAEQLLDGEAATITRKAIELAKQGELTALRLCLEHIVPPRPVNFRLPSMNSANDASEVIATIITAVAN